LVDIFFCKDSSVLAAGPELSLDLLAVTVEVLEERM
jgi:hypothetical protein